MNLYFRNISFATIVNIEGNNVKILRPVNIGAVIASAVLMAGYVNAAEPVATDGKTISNIEAPKSVNALTAKKPTPASSKSSSTAYDLLHTIVEGENIWVIAKQFTGDGKNWKAIAKANKLDDKGTVHPGQTILIPATLNKVALELAPADNLNDKKLVGKTKPEAQTSEQIITVPASFKGNSLKNLPK